MKNGRRERSEPAWLAGVDRLYGAALWLYPTPHRQRWGEAMRQACRDRCREAARAGRGPWRVLIVDLIPDLVASASREQADFLFGDASMKHTRLIVMLLALAGLIVFRVQLGDAALGAHDRWKQYQQSQYENALRQHEAALAALVEQTGGGHAGVIAAQLYATAGHGSRFYVFPQQYAWPLPVVENSAWLDRADAAFARALQADDTLALWLAVGKCPARAATCNAGSSLERLKHLDGDNGAVWLLDMSLAQQAHDPTRFRTDIARLAASPRMASHYADEMRGMLAAFALKQLPDRLRVLDADRRTVPSEQAAIVLAGNLADASFWGKGLGFNALSGWCDAHDPAAAERTADCRAAAKRMATGNDMNAADWIGARMQLRFADSTNRSQLRQSLRDLLWLNQQYYRLNPAESPEDARRWRAAWMAGGSEIQVRDRFLRDHGIATRAPASFEVDWNIYDPTP